MSELIETPKVDCTRRWKKLGLIFSPGQTEWMATHAQNPLPEDLGNGLFRVHFATRDRLNRARGGHFTFDIRDPSRVLEMSMTPSLDLGSLGAFDDSGVMPSGLVEYDRKKYLYYTGWSKAVDVPFSFHIGLAASEDQGKTYQRVSLAPVLGRNHYDPYITGAPYVVRENQRWKMWYIAGTKWEKDSPEAKPKHYYTIKYAESSDGFEWHCSSHICIQYREGEYAIARPVVWKNGDQLEMWFSYRGGNDTYRIGRAVSEDGIRWERLPESLGIDVSPTGWDSEMVCYAHPLVYRNQLYALYNGNSYGSTGIGLAALEA
jgi:hypothetical protein